MINYYTQEKNYSKVIYYYMKLNDRLIDNSINIINNFVNGHLFNNDVEITELFSDVYSSIEEFKHETIEEVCDNLLEESKKLTGKISQDFQDIANRLSSLINGNLED